MPGGIQRTVGECEGKCETPWTRDSRPRAPGHSTYLHICGNFTSRIYDWRLWWSRWLIIFMRPWPVFYSGGMPGWWPDASQRGRRSRSHLEPPTHHIISYQKPPLTDPGNLGEWCISIVVHINSWPHLLPLLLCWNYLNHWLIIIDTLLLSIVCENIPKSCIEILDSKSLSTSWYIPYYQAQAFSASFSRNATVGSNKNISCRKDAEE